MSIETNIEDRGFAELLMSDIESKLPSSTRPRFWEELIRLCQEHLPIEPQPSPDLGMSEEAAIQFENVRFPRGQYESTAVGLVDEEYIIWWAEKEEDGFTWNLKRYVKTERFKRRLRDQ